MRLLLFADKPVGDAVYRFLRERFPEDLALVATAEEGPLSEQVRQDGIPVEVIQNEADFLTTLRIKYSHEMFDLGILAWWPRIIRPPLLTLPKHGFVNFHPSLLPHNRGKHYNFWTIVDQTPFGVSLHFADEGVDTGDVVAQKTLTYDWTDTGESLYTKVQIAIVELFEQTYGLLRTLAIPRWPQDLSKGSSHRASELDSASNINLDRMYRARDLLNLLRARTFTGHPACYFSEGDKKYEVRIEIRRVTK